MVAVQRGLVALEFDNHMSLPRRPFGDFMRTTANQKSCTIFCKWAGIGGDVVLICVKIADVDALKSAVPRLYVENSKNITTGLSAT